MEATVTIAEHTVPEEIQTPVIESIVIIPQDKTLVVRLVGEKTVTADMTDDWANLSATKKSDFKAILKKGVAIALGITVSDITGEVWD